MNLFWPLILPFKITAAGIVAAIVLAVAVAPRFGQKRRRFFAWGFLLGTIAFVPSCTAVMMITDEFRFGVFHYPDFDSVNDFRIERYLPEPATDITVNKSVNGYQAAFTIDKETLDKWLTEYWDKYGEYSVVDREDSEFAEPVSSDESVPTSAVIDWSCAGSLLKYDGPFASNGASFEIWLCEEENTAFLVGWYW